MLPNVRSRWKFFMEKYNNISDQCLKSYKMTEIYKISLIQLI